MLTSIFNDDSDINESYEQKSSNNNNYKKSQYTNNNTNKNLYDIQYNNNINESKFQQQRGLNQKLNNNERNNELYNKYSWLSNINIIGFLFNGVKISEDKTVKENGLKDNSQIMMIEK